MCITKSVIDLLYMLWYNIKYDKGAYTATSKCLDFVDNQLKYNLVDQTFTATTQIHGKSLSSTLLKVK